MGVTGNTYTVGTVRLKAEVFGRVQGVGFRPHVFRLAQSLQLTGWVANSPQGARFEIEGDHGHVERFLTELDRSLPRHAAIRNLDYEYAQPCGYREFEVRLSEAHGPKRAELLPDLATCPECLQELFDPCNRRYRYPFINCTHCGPRYTITLELPYDRAHTTMDRFPLCPDCRIEYERPTNRRFHAQANACPQCGPHLELWAADGSRQATGNDAVVHAVHSLRQGRIVAMKGLGGFQLLVDAGSSNAVGLLRERKRRPGKPFALMAPSLESIEALCHVSRIEAQRLTSPQAPIVLLRTQAEAGASIAPEVAPESPYLGFMLPYTPLHHLLMYRFRSPLVATSGNLSEEPICIDEHEALDRLGSITDLFLVHNRPIARPVDDSVIQVVCGTEQVLRSARGYAPMTVTMREKAPPTLALGAHLKNSVAVASGSRVVVSQHIGNLENEPTCRSFETTANDLIGLHGLAIETVACDQHPDYHSTHAAALRSKQPLKVQHHLAHVHSCRLEHGLEGPLLGVVWDGVGLGTDGTVWGGEFFHLDHHGSVQRLASLRPFPLPGGDRVAVEPRRSALALLADLDASPIGQFADLPTIADWRGHSINVIVQMIRKRLMSPLCSSAGRFFDAVASILGLRQVIEFEGEAAMQLQYAGEIGVSHDWYPFDLSRSERSGLIDEIDWRPTLESLVQASRQGKPRNDIARCVHNTLAEIIATVAAKAGEPKVALTGGCFQNRLLTRLTLRRLTQAGFQVYWNQQVPPNDGGIAAGQVLAATKRATATDNRAQSQHHLCA